MLWILKFEEARKAEKVYFTDFEIYSEVRIVGALNYDNGVMLCGIIEEKNEQGFYTYLLRIKHADKVFDFDKSNYSKKGYFFPEGLIGELIAIFSIYFQTRFFLKSTTSGELTSRSIRARNIEPFKYLKPNKIAHYEMFDNQNRNWEYDNGLKLFLNKIRESNPDYHQNLIFAFQWYANAVKEIGTDHELFYLRMVSCIEALIEFVKLPDDHIAKKIKKLIVNDFFIKDEKQEIENWLKNRKIRKKFAMFVKENSNNFFKGGNKKASHCYIRKNELIKYLNRIYDARSKYLHCGIPMNISMSLVNKEGRDYDLFPGGGMFVDRKVINKNTLLPRPRWFERIINYSLKNYIETEFNKIYHMKKIIIKNRSNKKLSTFFHEPEKKTKKIIIITHSFKGDKDYQPIMREFSRHVCEKGYAVIRFDCWGSGESDGKFEDSSIETQIKDLEDVVKYVKKQGYEDICLIGLSLGISDSIMAYDESIKCMVMWSPVFQHEHLYEDYREEVEKNGYIIRKRNLTGEEVKCGKKMWQDFKDIKPYEKLPEIKCPVLSIIGSEDGHITEEKAEEYMNMLHSANELEVIQGGDHDFLVDKARDKAIKLTSDFIKKYL